MFLTLFRSGAKPLDSRINPKTHQEQGVLPPGQDCADLLLISLESIATSTPWKRPRSKES